MSILKDILIYEENKYHYTPEEREVIEKGLRKTCDELINKNNTNN